MCQGTRFARTLTFFILLAFKEYLELSGEIV